MQSTIYKAWKFSFKRHKENLLFNSSISDFLVAQINKLSTTSKYVTSLLININNAQLRRRLIIKTKKGDTAAINEGHPEIGPEVDVPLLRKVR